MKKFNYLLTVMLMAASPIFVGCSDDNDAPQLPTIQQGEIPAKNLFVTIDGTFIYNREGTAQISGTVDPNATEQHLQLTYPPMFILYPKNAPNDESLFEEIPVFDVTVKQESGKSLVAGRYEGNGYVINLSGELSVNYRGETDWNIEFTEEKSCMYNKTDNEFVGLTVEVKLDNECVYPQSLNRGNDDFEIRFKKLFYRILDAYKINSGYEAVRLSFVDECNYELWFKKAGEDEFVKDNLKHKYFIGSSRRLYLLDEIPYVKEQSKFLDLNCVGINFACGEQFFANDNTVTLPNSDTRYNVTRCEFILYYRYGGDGYIFIERADRKFFELFSPTGELGAGDSEFVEFRESEKNKVFHVEPSVKMTLVK